MLKTLFFMLYAFVKHLPHKTDIFLRLIRSIDFLLKNLVMNIWTKPSLIFNFFKFFKTCLIWRSWNGTLEAFFSLKRGIIAWSIYNIAVILISQSQSWLRCIKLIAHSVVIVIIITTTTDTTLFVNLRHIKFWYALEHSF